MKTKMIQTAAGIFLPSFRKSASKRQQISIGDFDLVSVDCWFMELVYFIQNLPIQQNIFFCPRNLRKPPVQWQQK